MVDVRRGRSGRRGSGGSSIKVYFEFTPNRGLQDRFPQMLNHMLRELQRRAASLAERMEVYAQDNAPWQDHPDNHPSVAYPNADVLRDTIRGSASRQGDLFAVTMTYVNDIHRTKKKDYTYGGILEQYTGGGRYAAIIPTFEDFEPELVELLAGGLLTGYRGAGAKGAP